MSGILLSTLLSSSNLSALDLPSSELLFCLGKSQFSESIVGRAQVPSEKLTIP